MHKTFHGSARRGFNPAASGGDWFAHRSYCAALKRILEATEDEDGYLILTGTSGIGKTHLVNHASTQLERAGLLVGKVVNAQVDAEDLLRLVGFAFGLDAETLNTGRLLTSLKAHFVGEGARARPVVLFIDEAHSLSLAAIDELNLLYELATSSGEPLLIVLAGQGILSQMLLQPEYRHINELVIDQCRLEPLSLAESNRYIEHSLAVSGRAGNPQLSPDAMEQIHVRTQGVPRRINEALGRLLVHGGLLGAHNLEAQDVDSALAQLSFEHPAPLFESDLPLFGHSGSRPNDAQHLQVVGAEPETPGGTNLPGLVQPQRTNANATSQAITQLRLDALRFRSKQPPHPILALLILALLLIPSNRFDSDQTAPSPPQVAEPLEPTRATLATDATPQAEKPAPSPPAAQPLAEAEAPADATNGARSSDGEQSAIEAPAELQPALSDLLAKAETALAEYRLTVPTDDNAYEYYRAVLARDPDNAAASSGLGRIVAAYRGLARRSLDRGNYRLARLYASRGLKIASRDPELEAIRRRARTSRAPASESDPSDFLDRIGDLFRSGDSSKSLFLETE